MSFDPRITTGPTSASREWREQSPDDDDDGDLIADHLEELGIDAKAFDVHSPRNTMLGGILVSIDLEGSQKVRDVMQIGVASLNLDHVRRISPGPKFANWLPHIKTFSLRWQSTKGRNINYQWTLLPPLADFSLGKLTRRLSLAWI